MREYTDEKRYKLVMDSNKYYRLFMTLNWTPDYPRNLARKFDVSIATVGEMLDHMLQLHLVKRVEKKKGEGRMQYYRADWRGFYKAVKRELLPTMTKETFPFDESSKSVIINSITTGIDVYRGGFLNKNRKWIENDNELTLRTFINGLVNTIIINVHKAANSKIA